MRRARRRLPAIFAAPAAIALATAIGLAAGLMGEGGWDRIAWAGLLVPVAVAWRAR